MDSKRMNKISDGNGEAKRTNALCCCEYINHENERFHILQCCCNCSDLDAFFDRLICCTSVDPKHSQGMLLTFQDRLRIPWQGGAKQISLGALVPPICIPLVISIAAINSYAALIMCIATALFLGYSYYYLRRSYPKTKFFFIWTFWSVVYLIFLFGYTVPMMELLPEENYILVLLGACSLFCLYRTKTRAPLNHVLQSTVSEDELPDITEEQTSLLIENSESDECDQHNPNICQICRKYVQPRTLHCSICQACIVRHDHHSFWLDCCIGKFNHRYYFFCLCFGQCALLFGANLATTAVCHPYLLFKIFGVPILLPDDCSDVFDDYIISLAFIMSIYALIMAFFVIIALFMQIYLISKGITLSEWKRRVTSKRRMLLSNWKSFFFLTN